MDWYKHSTGSHDDPDISDAMDEFGDFGYSGFFIILDLYGQEYEHINGDGYLQLSKAFLRRKLRKSWTKVELLLNFYSKKILNPRFVWIDKGSHISLQVPKFIELASSWTGRKKRKQLQSPYVAPTAIEGDKEDKNIKKEKEKDIPEEKTSGISSVDLAFEVHSYLVKKIGHSWNLKTWRDNYIKILKNYSLEECKLAIDGFTNSEWYMKNQSSKAPDLIFRNNKKFEEFLEKGKNPELNQPKEKEYKRY